MFEIQEYLMPLTEIETRLLEGCRNNDRVAQEDLYHLYCDEMFAICRSYAKGYDASCDILQESFIKAFKSIDQYQERSSLKSWIKKIVVNTAIDHYRRSLRVRNLVSTDEARNVSVDQDVLSEIGAQELYQLIDELPRGFRTVFNLYVVEGYSHKEIANQLGINEGTSKSQLARARKALQIKVMKLYQTESPPYANAK